MDSSASRPADSSPPAEPGRAGGVKPGADGEHLTPLHPNYKSALRLQTVIFFVPVLLGALILEAVLASEGVPIPSGSIAGPLLLLAIFLIVRLPQRRFAARGYQMSDDRLRVVRGILWHSDTIVPFGRVQHIDVDQGPLERFFKIATLTLHTAGTHNASVDLPGLGEDHARAMREDIRAHIKRETV
jgi:hypothetical protein